MWLVNIHTWLFIIDFTSNMLAAWAIILAIQLTLVVRAKQLKLVENYTKKRADRPIKRGKDSKLFKKCCKKNAEQYEVKRNERKTTPSKRSEVFLFIGTYVNFSGHVRKWMVNAFDGWSNPIIGKKILSQKLVLKQYFSCLF